MWLVAVLVGLGVLASGLFLVYAEEGRGERPLLVPERGRVEARSCRKHRSAWSR